MAVINKTIMHQNRIKSLHHSGTPSEQKRICTNIPDHLYNLPAQLAQELKSIPADWTMGDHRNQDSSPSDDGPAYLTTLLDAAISAAAPASREAASRSESVVV